MNALLLRQRPFAHPPVGAGGGRREPGRRHLVTRNQKRTVWAHVFKIVLETKVHSVSPRFRKRFTDRDVQFRVALKGLNGHNRCVAATDDLGGAAMGRRARKAPAKLCACGPRRSDAAALTMGHVERRDGRRCIAEGARPRAVDRAAYRARLQRPSVGRGDRGTRRVGIDGCNPLQSRSAYDSHGAARVPS